ncbi:15744_t:CDS:2 [Cetraspora pellucida]|uniref:15744_t:CDS:1 n=1 Tax=Cetraspora pellucida TaxID=1433469 RepID=A0ACA9MDJ7_9GLOM|nr:15744_t:CDS:2 [Cetraspora pellucida]
MTNIQNLNNTQLEEEFSLINPQQELTENKFDNRHIWKGKSSRLEVWSIKNHYQELKKLFPERIHIINADQSETEILTEVQEIIKQTRVPKSEARLPQSVRPGETPEAAACREVFEETNLTIENCQKIAEENVFYANLPPGNRH